MDYFVIQIFSSKMTEKDTMLCSKGVKKVN